MTTLLDFSISLKNMKKALDAIEVKGIANASLLVYASNQCTKMLKAIDEVTDEFSSDQTDISDNNQNGSEEVSTDGDNNSNW